MVYTLNVNCLEYSAVYYHFRFSRNWPQHCYFKCDTLYIFAYFNRKLNFDYNNTPFATFWNVSSRKFYFSIFNPECHECDKTVIYQPSNIGKDLYLVASTYTFKLCQIVIMVLSNFFQIDPGWLNTIVKKDYSFTHN